MKYLTLLAAAGLAIASTQPAAARDQIRIVGSSTVYPFSTMVAENFGRGSNFKIPVVESTGTGGGFKLFCSGIGEQYPDIANASRAIKSAELADCNVNGVKGVVEVKVGYDGIVVANAVGSPQFQLTTRDLFLALAKDIPTADGKLIANPHKSWRDVNPALPAQKIEVFGPPPTSGTRDAFAELAMEAGCSSFDSMRALKSSDEKRFKAICHSFRTDGAFIEAGENDNLIIQKLTANRAALGIFGFSFFDQNADKVQASLVNGSEAAFETIADGSYPISRPLFFYVKKQHVDNIPGLREFVLAFISDNASGEDGYLADLGLIPLDTAERVKRNTSVKNFTPLGM